MRDSNFGATGVVRRTRTNWPTVGFLILFHLAGVAALFFWSWPAAIVGLVLYWVGGSLGIGIGFHRLLTHRSFTVPKFVEYFLVLCGTLALEGGPIQWVTTHRIHHAHTDREEDPHTPRHGGWWAHVGWILHPTENLKDKARFKRYAPELVDDAFYRWLNRFYYVPLIALAIALLGIGGVRVMLWGIFLRVTIGLHCTWLVNSATHLWGKQRFLTREDSRNSLWVALLTFGEGWHNNHHAFPRAARHGLFWYEIDLNWIGIRVLQCLGVAKAITLMTNDQIEGKLRLASSHVARGGGLRQIQQEAAEP
jgi:fatty-acid desaturase